LDLQDLDEALSADAAELEAAMAKSPHDDEVDEIIELSDIVDRGELQTDRLYSDQEDDEIIELTDIVDPAELKVPAIVGAPDDEEIIELTDIVDPAELEAPLVDEESPQREPAEILAVAGAVAQGTEQWGARTTLDPIPIGAIPPFEDEPQTEEGLVRLTNVLNLQTSEGQRLPIEQIKMGAEEELATQAISLEAEDRAEALGLSLEKEPQEESSKLKYRDIETAVERVIEKKYAATIEHLIAQAVEKAVTREMESIKRAMLDGDEPQT
jgi:dihydroneopterin aldolase